MLRSMTGFASSMYSGERYDIFMELKSVNSRYFEFKARSAFFLSEIELEIRNRLFKALQRGKLDLFIKVVEKSAENYQFVVNSELAKEYEKAVRELSDTLALNTEITMQDLLRVEGILSVERNANDPELEKQILLMLDELIEKIGGMMDTEGKKTVEDIETRLNVIQKSTQEIEGLYPESITQYKEALRDRISEFDRRGMDEGRLLMEVEMVASRTAINEEFVRLYSHVRQFKAIIEGKKPGDSKKLDFISQEMNREANTIASKSSDVRIIDKTIVIKSEIEKIREQLRNLG